MKRKIVGFLFYIIGILVIAYPILSNFINSYNQTVVISNYEENVNKLSDDQKEKELQKAQKYNDELENDGIVDISLNSSGEEEQEHESYLDVLNIGEAMGYISIPKIDVYLPIYHNTSEDVLQFGVGHLKGTSLPIGGKGTHSVLSGHTGLVRTKIFDDIDELEIGDKFYIYILGQTLTYQVDNIQIVEPDNVNAIERNSEKDYVTLLTCTPYMVNSHRLLVRGERIENDESEEIEVSNNDNTNIINPGIEEIKTSRKFLMISVVIVFFGILIFVILRIFGDRDEEEKHEDKS